MNYRKNGLSILGFGCLRFPKKGNTVDLEEVEKEIGYAIEQGINYFDTAYIYPGNEEVIGKILAKNQWRKKINLATKIPHYMIKQPQDFEKFFQEQLKRLKTESIDYYLMHMLPDVKVWNRLQSLGLQNWIKEKKREGKIRKIGFSYHGNSSNFMELIDAYSWDFCQIQYNYMDENSQAGRAGLEYAAKKGIPVMIMEPLRGGKLAQNLPKGAQELITKEIPHRSPAEWGLRWLWNQPGVSVVLSGMNSMEMLKENIRIANEVSVGEIDEKQQEFFQRLKRKMEEGIPISCTGCGYCMPCPKGVDIPGSFRCYNASYIDGYKKGFKEYVMCTTMGAKRSNVSLCVECGRCEKHCPQGISIRQELKKVKKRMEHPIYKVAAWYIKKRMIGR